MKDEIFKLPNPEAAWMKFLDFDKKITQTIEKECLENNISLCRMTSTTSVGDFAKEVAYLMGL